MAACCRWVGDWLGGQAGGGCLLSGGAAAHTHALPAFLPADAAAGVLPFHLSLPLQVLEVQAPGKRVMAARDFANGLKGRTLLWQPLEAWRPANVPA